MKKESKKTKGFTLIELLVVVLIIGILAAIALPQYKKSVLRAEAVQMKLDVAHAVQAAERYYLVNSKWPNSFPDLDIDFVLPEESGKGNCAWGINTIYPHKVNSKIGFAFGKFDTNTISIISYYLDGKYKCAGFIYYQNGIFCIEEAGKYFGDYPKTGSYCHDILGLELFEDVQGDRYYK